MRLRLTVLAATVVVLVVVTAAMAATINGTQGPDEIYGTGSADTISAGAGDDFVQGRGGDDTIRGNKGEDHLYGGVGDDYIAGGPTQPWLQQSVRTRDLLFGRAGNDTLVTIAPSGGGYLEGGAGDDTFRADNGSAPGPDGNFDVLSCGIGFDVARVDATDEPAPYRNWANAGCDRVYVDGELRWLTIDFSSYGKQGAFDKSFYERDGGIVFTQGDSVELTHNGASQADLGLRGPVAGRLVDPWPKCLSVSLAPIAWQNTADYTLAAYGPRGGRIASTTVRRTVDEEAARRPPVYRTLSLGCLERPIHLFRVTVEFVSAPVPSNDGHTAFLVGWISFSR